MIAAIVVRLPFRSRPVALPVLAKLVHKNLKPAPASRLVLARQMTAALAAALPGQVIHVVADAAYAGKDLRRLPAAVTCTTRLRKDAALHELPSPRTGKRGRPRVKGPGHHRPGRRPGRGDRTVRIALAVEAAIEDAKQLFGARQARNRVAAAVHRTLPFALACQAIAVLCYATAGHHPADVAEHRARALPGTRPRLSHRPPT